MHQTFCLQRSDREGAITSAKNFENLFLSHTRLLPGIHKEPNIKKKAILQRNISPLIRLFGNIERAESGNKLKRIKAEAIYKLLLIDIFDKV